MAPVNKNLIHTWQTGNVSHLNNRFLNKCRGNFFPPASKKARCPGRFRLPRPATHRVEAATGPAQSVPAPTHRREYQRTPQSSDRAELRAKAFRRFLLRRKEDSRRSDRKFPLHVQADYFSE